MQGDRIKPTTPIEPVLRPGHSYASISDKISDIVVKRKTTLGWFIGFGAAFSLVMVLLFSVGYLFIKGPGIWGVDIPVAWGFAIINFVWWIGIGHAGTLISAFLLLMRQDWRTSINRFAEAMTLFAVACAGLFPILHLGRPWLAYWLIPYPNTMGLWPQFRSPLDWDFFAVSTYATVSLLFWYIGLIPDMATMRDSTTKRVPRLIFGMMALGWRGSAQHWHRYQMAYLLMAGLATPLVVSVHSIVSIDFSAAIVPGWHSTIFPPYFVIGAIYSGFAMVLTLAIPLRRFFGLQDFVTKRHLNIMAKLLLLMGLGVTYGYMIELFMSWYSGDQFETYMSLNRMFGPYWLIFWSLIACNVVIPQVLWFPRVRSSTLALFAVALVVNVGMWLERFMIVVTSLHRDFVPSSWGTYRPTFWDWSTFAGTIGLFFALFFLFVRVLPMIPMFEMRELLTHREGHTRAEQQKLAAEPVAVPEGSSGDGQPKLAPQPSRSAV